MKRAVDRGCSIVVIRRRANKIEQYPLFFLDVRNIIDLQKQNVILVCRISLRRGRDSGETCRKGSKTE